MDALTRLVANHNLTTICNCSVCNIYRMCEQMEALTIRTNALIQACYDYQPTTRPDVRTNSFEGSTR